MVGRRAEVFDRLSGLGLRWLYRSVARRVVEVSPPPRDLLDIGTGPGRLLLELARRRPDAHLVGIDPSADMIDRAVAHARAAGIDGRVDAQVSGAEDLPFADDSFDAVVSTLSSHHWADPDKAVAEQVRVLRPGGRLWVVDLRVAIPEQVPQALARELPPAALSRQRLGLVAATAFVCHQAVKPS